MLFYADKANADERIIIEKCDGKNLRDLGDELKERYLRLPGELIRDDALFRELYALWIDVCVAYMNQSKRSEEVLWDGKQAELLFYPGANEEECSTFLEMYCERLSNPRYTICRKQLCNRICNEIDGSLQGLPLWMLLRVKAVCILLKAMPEEVFEEGKLWAGSFSQEKVQQDRLSVENGMIFTLDFGTEIERLFPKTLYNDSETLCTIQISYQGKNYPVKLPPYGMLRAVFADENCKRMVNIKGNISFNDAKSAVVQQSDEEGIKLCMYYRQSGMADIPTPGGFLDAAADTQGGVLLLTVGEMRSSTGLVERKAAQEELPIRCYGAGRYWARWYADGRLETNQHDEIGNAISVAENRGRGLLIRNRESAWGIQGGRIKKITDEEFFDGMMSRFLQENVCESISTTMLQLSINNKGILEGKRL